MQQTTGILLAENQHSRLVLNLLIGEQLAVVCRVGHHKCASVDDHIEAAQSVQELNVVPLIVEQLGGNANVKPSFSTVTISS